MTEHKSFLCHRRFKNAYWILTNKETKENIKYNYSEMSKAIREVYTSYWNGFYALPPYSEDEIDANNVIVRCLHQGGCNISKERGWVIAVGYSQIFPEYDIECYDYRYQCPKCQYVFDEIARQGQKRTEEIYCLGCHEFVSV